MIIVVNYNKSWYLVLCLGAQIDLLKNCLLLCLPVFDIGGLVNELTIFCKLRVAISLGYKFVISGFQMDTKRLTSFTVN